jgi:hypothetical protein
LGGRIRILGYDALALLLEAGGVLHEVAHRDRFSFAPRNLKIEVLIHVSIEIDLALLDELHHRGPSEELRH